MRFAPLGSLPGFYWDQMSGPAGGKDGKLETAGDPWHAARRATKNVQMMPRCHGRVKVPMVRDIL